MSSWQQAPTGRPQIGGQPPTNYGGGTIDADAISIYGGIFSGTAPDRGATPDVHLRVGSTQDQSPRCGLAAAFRHNRRDVADIFAGTGDQGRNELESEGLWVDPQSGSKPRLASPHGLEQSAPAARV